LCAAASKTPRGVPRSLAAVQITAVQASAVSPPEPLAVDVGNRTRPVQAREAPLRLD
jgi:hypothetical protein